LGVIYLTGALVIALTGPGDFSLDHLLGFDTLVTEDSVWIALAVAVLGAFSNLAMRKSLLPGTPTSARKVFND
jgi:hypothetical protein